jgi:hypothetical protein
MNGNIQVGISPPVNIQKNTIASYYLLVCLWLFPAGFFVTIFISPVLLKSNDIQRKVTAL